MKKLIFLFLLLNFLSNVHTKTHSIYLQHNTEYQHSAEYSIVRALNSISDGYVLSVKTLSKVKEILLSIVSNNGAIALNQGDQLIIFLDVHGAPGNKNEQTHSIASLNESLSIDQLLPYIRLLAEQNIRVLLSDQSCYSAPTTSLVHQSMKLQSNLCVITGDSVNAPAMATFGESLFFNLKSIKNAEEWFLKSRNNIFSSNASPSISTPEGQVCARALEELNKFQSFISFWNFSDFLAKNGLAIKERIQKKIDFKFTVIKELHRKLSNLIPGLKESDKRLTRINEIIKSIYNDTQSLILKYPETSKSNEYLYTFPNGMKLTWGEAYKLLSDTAGWHQTWMEFFNLKLSMLLLQGKISFTIPQLFIDGKISLEKYQELISISPIETHPVLQAEVLNLKTYIEILDAEKRLPKEFQSLSKDDKNVFDSYAAKYVLEIGEIERELYNQCYESMARQYGNKNNACNNFVLNFK